MRMTWYKRLLLSYFPILFITVSIMIFIFVSIISQYSIVETKKANEVMVYYVTDSIQTSLNRIENSILESLSLSKELQDFYESKSSDTSDERMVNYEASKVLGNILENNPLISSIYLYRVKDNKVLTTDRIVRLQDFPDEAFVHQILEQTSNTGWTSHRTYMNTSLEKKQDVISLSKKALIPFGRQGLIVVNVDLSDLLGIVEQMINKKITFLNIFDQKQHQVYPLNPSETEDQHGEIMNEVHLDSPNWTVVSGVRSSLMFGWIAVISRYWFLLGGIVIVLSGIYLIFITRKNYKPIENIMERIQSFQNMKGKNHDEFSFINRVLERLMLQTDEYEKQYQEDLIVMRKQFFQELIEGKMRLTESDWQTDMRRFNLNPEFSGLTVAVVEIDRYDHFQMTYNGNDQQLFKFALTNVVNELLQDSEQTVWAEWVGVNRLAILHISRKLKVNENETWDLIDKLRTWVAIHLKFSVTIGLGSVKYKFEDVYQSYDQAVGALCYTLSMGNNQVISYEEIVDGNPGGIHKYVPIMNALIHDFRILSPSWQLQLEQFVQFLDQDLLKNEDIYQLFQYFIRLVQRELYGANAMEGSGKAILLELQMKLETTDSLEMMLEEVSRVLQEMFKRYSSAQEAQSNYQLLISIRQYIEGDYANQDLSLNLISEQFGVNAKYASQLFKEQFGMKFIDFLVNIRMEAAKRLLVETESPVQDIAEKVGYTHSISFGRTFKKIVGVTPGDYRKYMQGK